MFTLIRNSPIKVLKFPVVNFQRSISNGDASIRQTRIVKRIVAGVLFSSTLGLAIYSKRARSSRLMEYLEGCERLPKDLDYNSSTATELYRLESFVFPYDIIKSGILKQLDTLDLNHNDIIVASFPKSGTTWLQEIVYLVKTGLDFKGAQKQVLESRFPYLEYPYPGLSTIKKTPSPKMIKTHLPLTLLPKSTLENGAKVIYILRNPKDVAVSYYYFLRMASFVSYKGTFEKFVKKFIQGEVPYGPYFKHVLDYWSYFKENPNGNLLLLTYEDMHKDPIGSIKLIAKFLDCPLTDDQASLIAEHTHFDRMAKNPSVNYSHWDDLGLRNKNESLFMRQGLVGDWVRHFNADTNASFDSFIQQNLRGSDLQFQFFPDVDHSDEKSSKK